MNIDPILKNFFENSKKLKDLNSEYDWKSKPLYDKKHAKDETDVKENLEELKETINIIENEIKNLIIKNKEQFDHFFSDEFILKFTQESHKDYVRPRYGYQGIIEDNEYDSFQFWKESSEYWEKQKDCNFRDGVNFFNRLEAILEWKQKV